MEQEAIVTNIQRFCVHDGPGVRTTVFFKGCPLSCRWCHNPETQKKHIQPQVEALRCVGCGLCEKVCPAGCHRFSDGKHSFDNADCTLCMACLACPVLAIRPCGREMAVSSILDEVLKDRAFYGETGGITLSGGEPMAQPEAALALLRAAKAAGITTCMETCGQFDEKFIKPLCAVCDTLLWDVKDTNSARHKAYTGVGNERILKNLSLAAEEGAAIILRCILVKGVNDERAHVENLLALARKTGAEKIDFLPFHPMGNGKAAAVGNHGMPPMGKEHIPDAEFLAWCRQQKI